MMRQPQLFISPHRDDACFSMAATISLLGGGHLLNIFTRSKYTSHPTLANEDAPLSEDLVSAIRKREDHAFACATNLKVHDLDFTDADLRGLSWDIQSEQEFLVQAVELARQIYKKLKPILQKLTPSFPSVNTTVYCPMGIGGHRDHLTTLLAMRMIKYTTWGQKQQWLFYEDLPYASWEWAREEGIRRFQAIMKGTSIQKYCLPLEPEQLINKMQLVSLYASQHPTPPTMQNFICCDSRLLGPHEGLWKETYSQ